MGTINLENEKRVRVIIADDHNLVRTGLRMMLEEMTSYEVVAETESGLDTVAAVEEHKPDLLILDMQMPNLGGMEVLGRLSHSNNSPQVLIVSASEPGLFVAEAFKKGASGCVLKDSTREEFHQALNTLRDGKKYLSPVLADHLLQASEHGVINSLSEREREVFKLLAEGKKNKEIAKLLYVSQRTIDTHRLNLMKKLGLATNGEITQLALKNGLI